ncbi:MAG: IS200/IS605 family transposase [Coriobacteriales bacterium]|jgi:putative transposase|nr:IS200/IS605 family transposase [Coriobacteriales bacterium]
MPESSLAHTVWDCTYHVVWTPKYRRRVLFGQCRRQLTDILRELADKKPGVEIVQGAMCPDHVHLCLRIPPKYSVSNIMGYLKGKSAMELAQRIPEQRRNREKEKSFWARGCYVSTVGMNEAVIRKHIRQQQKADMME